MKNSLRSLIPFSVCLGMATISAYAAAPVALDDILLVAEDSSVTTDYLLANDSDQDSDVLTITATSAPAHGAVLNNGGGSYTYTPTAGFTGDDSFTYYVSDGSTTVSATVRVSVNAAIDATTTRDALLAGVTSIADPANPGHMTAWGPTAVIVSNYEGEDERRPMIVAGTMGSGRVVAMGDHQWFNMNNFGALQDTGAFYLNSMAWAAGTSDKTIKVVVYGFEVNASIFLANNGFTNVVQATNGNVVSHLATADVCVTWMDNDATLAIQDAVEDFTKGGGGLLVCDFGIGYSWWWGKDGPDIPGNRVLRDVGIGFTQTYPNDGVQTINRATLQITDDDVQDTLLNPGSHTTGEQERAAAIYEQLNYVLPSEDTLQARLDAVFWSKVGLINPTPDNPVTDSVEQALLTQEANMLKDLPVEQVTAHRTAEAVYGAISGSAPRVTRVINVDTSVPRWHSTGLYAAPGEILTITIPYSVSSAGYRVRLSGHTDNISSRDAWARVPFGTSRDFALNGTTVQVASAFGGAVYIDTGKTINTTASFDVTVQGAVEAPYFILGTTTDAQWIASIRDNPAPYAELVSNHLTLSVPSSFIRTIDNMEEIMTYWDQVVARQDYIGGMEDLRANQTAERINVDVQISVGLLHAGYPIQGPISASGGLMDYQKLMSSGDWGYFHELGHESQLRPDKYWSYNNPYTFFDDVEVTVNIFANAALEHSVPKPDSSEFWSYSAYPDQVMRKSLEAVATGGTFDSKSPYPFYFQLADGFGWEMYRDVFKTYHYDELHQSWALPDDSAEKKDQWLVRWSQTAGVSMKKFMVDEWGLTVSASALSQISSLPDWLPVTGGLSSAMVLIGDSVVLDLSGEALSYDGVATVSNVTQGNHGAVTSNGDGTWTYTADSVYEGEDSFSYDVISSTGHAFATTVAVRISHEAVLLERWDNIAGASVSDLTSDPRYPDSPTHTSLLSDFDTGENLADQYGARMRSWLVAPTTGDYTFWISSNNKGELHLSTDSNPANLQLIGSVDGLTNYKSWDSYASQKSSLIHLVAGQHYYIEALVKESLSSDHLAVAWSGPGFSRKDLTSEVLVLTTNSTLTLNNETFAIGEGSAVATLVGTVTATDSEPQNTLSYAITAGNIDNAFSINSDGEITTAIILDFETTAQYILTVTVTNDATSPESATATVTVNVEDNSDTDTLDDSWELAYFGDITSQDAEGDPDGDGLTNLQEFAFDDDPTSGATSGKVVSQVADVGGTSRLTLTLPVRGAPIFNWDSDDAWASMLSAPVDGLIYRIEASKDLSFDGSNRSYVDEVTPALSAGLPPLNTGWNYRTFRTGAEIGVEPSDFIRITLEEAP